MPDVQYFSHDLKLSPTSSPADTIFPAKLAYKTFGDPKNPAVLLPTCYGGHIDETTPFIYEPLASPSGGSPSPPPLPASSYFIIVTGLLGGSESSSPSNASGPYAGADFPRTTYEDNIRLQRALCTHLGVTSLFAYIGFSMGGQQAYHMAALFPGFARRVVVLAGSARTSWHNYCFLEGPKAALVNSVDFHDGRYTSTSPCVRGTGAFGRVYSAWALSQAWFRQRCWEKCGYATLDAYLEAEWEEGLGAWDANDLLCLLSTWQKGDITIYHPEDKGSLDKALGRIDAKCLIMPSRTDTYFPPEDSEEECKHLRHAKYVPIESIWGHMAGGGGGTHDDTKFIQEQVRIFCQDTS